MSLNNYLFFATNDFILAHYFNVKRTVRNVDLRIIESDKRTDSYKNGNANNVFLIKKIHVSKHIYVQPIYFFS